MGLSRSSTSLDPIWRSSSKNYPLRIPRSFTDLDEDTKFPSGRKFQLKLEPLTAGYSQKIESDVGQTKEVWDPVIDEVSNVNAAFIELHSTDDFRNNFEKIKLNKSHTIEQFEICRCPKKMPTAKSDEVSVLKFKKGNSFTKASKHYKWRKDFSSNFISNSFEFDENHSKHVKKLKSKKVLHKQGQRFKSVDGREAAATLIQSIWKMHVKRTAYLHYRKQKWAAGMIAISWIMNAKLSKIRKQLINTNRSLIDSYRLRKKVLEATWVDMKQTPRTIIHIPSLGLSQRVRYNLPDISLEQNRQMARLCDLSDPNVKIIYVSPVPVSEEFQQYFSKLLGLKPAVESGDVEQQCNVDDRFTIVVPDALESFPAHKMCLSSILKYSPMTVKRIRNLVAGTSAYIVPGVIHKDELHISDMLDVPVLGPEPDVANVYSTKSGLKRIFGAAKIEQPPSEYDIKSLEQLIESLAQLVTENLDVKRWIIKIDDEFNGRGIAVCPVTSYLKCYQWALKQRMRYGDKWDKKWAHEPAFHKILEEVPYIIENFTDTINKEIYPTWEVFLAAFIEKGGVVEAYPPSDNTTAISVDVLIEPTGDIQIISQGDQIHAETEFSCWGTTFPQCSIDPSKLNAATMKIAKTCRDHAVIGYITIDFVTFLDPQTENQKLWAIDLNMGYSDQAAMTKLTTYVSNAIFDPENSTLTVSEPPTRVPSKHRRRRREEKPFNPNRFAVMSTRLYHTNLSVIHYSVFFQMCRAQGIGYDLKERQGCIFTLLDSYSRKNIGMICLHDQLPPALATFARNLNVIHQELSSPAMQGESNYHAVIKDIEAILGVAVVNEENEKQQAQDTAK